MKKKKYSLLEEIPAQTRGSQVKAIYSGTISVVVVAFALVLGNMWYDVKADLEQDLKRINRLFQQSTEAILIHHETILRVLGRRLLERDADHQPASGRVLVEELLGLNGSIAGFGLARADGQLVLVSGIPPGKSLPNLLQQAASSASFQAALTSERMVVGDTYYLPLLNRWLVPTRISLRDAYGAVHMVMTAGIDIDSPETLWNALGPDEGMRLTLMRDDGHVQLLIPSPVAERRTVYQHRTRQPLALEVGPGEKAQDPLVSSTFADAKRLPRYGLTAISSYPNSKIMTEFGRRIIWPGIFFLAAMFASWLLYRYISRHQQVYEEHLIYQAHHDALTGLPNRFLLRDRLRHDLDQARRNSTILAVIYLDLDQFKRVNDSYGHEMGDHLLKACALRLQKIFRDGDTFGRLGGDEFLLILPDFSAIADVQNMAIRVMNEFVEPFECVGTKLYSTASMGIALFPQDGDKADVLLQNADTALYKAKDEGRNSFFFFQSSLNKATARRVAVETELRQALSRGELSLHYQPKSSLESEQWLGAEALLRWSNPTLGQVSPVEFIPIAEETGLIIDIGWFVIARALQTLLQILPDVPDFCMAINVSVRQLQDPAFVQKLLYQIKESGVPPALIEIEVTESILLEGRLQLQMLRDAGLRLAVDDFGTGFSSLSYLKRLPVTTLKIDREFIRDLENDTADAAVTTAIITLARELNLVTVAEGVETVEQRAILQQKKCTQMQGYLLSVPLPEKLFLAKLLLAPVASAQ